MKLHNMNCNNEKSLSELQPYDIICGRDKVCYHNVGNKRFRILISLNLNKYLMATTRSERSALIHSLTEDLLDGHCKFCFWKRVNNSLMELDREQIREKVGHALRDAKSKQKSNSARKSIAKAMVEQPRRLSTVLTLDDLDDDINSALDTLVQDASNQPNQNHDDSSCLSSSCPRRLSTFLTQQDVDDYESDGTNRESDTSISLVDTFDIDCDKENTINIVGSIPPSNNQQFFVHHRRASCASHVSAFEPVDCVTAFDISTVVCH